MSNNQAQHAAVLQAMGSDGLRDILSKLDQGGLGQQVDSWIDEARKSIPVTAEQVRDALGNEQVRKIATQLGFDPDQLAEILAKILPSAAEKAGADAAPGKDGARANKPDAGPLPGPDDVRG